ncbi:MAG TPA: cyclodeaminase/cyclohydrolase family protein [bacterium]|jgi:formiminotetrahydrofolate cyclodeaminase|nr:cyclodeaminase/cyclohydrolase family protein [bacterium]
MPRSESLGSYLDALASAAPTPGGGAAAAWTLAQAAALLCMVARLTQGKAQALRHEASLALILEDALAVKAAAERLADADSLAFQSYGLAAARPKDSPEGAADRSAGMQAALGDAARVPLAVHELCAHLLGARGAVRVLARIGNPRVLSDVNVARSLAKAALSASAENVQVNLNLIKDPALAAPLRVRLARSEAAWDEEKAPEAGAGADAGESVLPDPQARAWVDAVMRAVPDHLFTA